MTNPTFSIRGFNMCESLLRHTPDQLRQFIRRMKNLRMNTLIVHYDYGWRRYKEIILQETAKAGVEITLMTFGPQTFLGYSDWKKMWFAKREDGSLYTDTLECETQLCRFQSEAIEAFCYGAQKWLKALPSQIMRVHMRAADGLDFCQCEKCRLLPDQEKWQPFVEAFVNAVYEVRPDLAFETDVYVKRYNLPAEKATHRKMSRIMYDTFFRHNHVPIGVESWNKGVMHNVATELNPDAASPNIYHANRLREWCSAVPGKLYIHENAMGQSLQGTFQHNTGVMLKDLELYRQLGVQGVCYEAYEPGYINFSEHFEVLASAMLDIDKFADYNPTVLEKEITTKWKMEQFCDDYDFQLEAFLDNPIQLEHVEYFRRCWVNPSSCSYRKYIQFAFEHEDTLDPLFIGFFNAKWGIEKGALDFSAASAEARHLISHRKLWDFMEKVSLDDNPIAKTKRLMLNLAEAVRNIGQNS